MVKTDISLKLMFYNAENFFFLSDEDLSPEHTKLDETQWQKLSTSIYENKPLNKSKAIANMIHDINPDIIMFCEVGGLESLENFNHLFLHQKYSAALIEGNSERHIDVGFLIRKELPFYFDLMSNKNRPINYLYPHERMSAQSGHGKNLVSHKFSRDLAELRLFSRDRDKPFLNLMLTHLKSRLDPDGIDPNGFERRQAELKTLIELYSEFKTKHDIPIVVAGDFNGNASRHNTDKEFLDLYSKTDLEDVAFLDQLTHEERATFFQINKNSANEGRQIDFAFLNSQAQKFFKKKSAHVYRYKDKMGFPIPVPSTMDAKLALPSDHYPVIFELENLPLIPKKKPSTT